MKKRKKKRKNNYQPPRNMPPRNPYVPSSSTQSKTDDEDLESPIGFVKFLLFGHKKENPRPLTFGICLRRFFIVLDNLIAAALLFYLLTWIKFYSNGADTSSVVIIDDMSTLCLENVLGALLVIIVTWRWLYDNDSLPCLKNFTYRDPYVDCATITAIFSFAYAFVEFMLWLRFIWACGLMNLIMDLSGDTDSTSTLTWDNYMRNMPDQLPLWAQEIRIVILGVVFLIRHLLLNDTDQKYGRKIFERKSSETQQAPDVQEGIVPPNEEETVSETQQDTDTQEVTEPLSEEETNSSRDDQTEG
ncbi:MAG: hypothetical protein IK131_08550 [Paludibacteraceae bacterium]|nr:hypothetical protein [Paludibacteraceae bacterium]